MIITMNVSDAQVAAGLAEANTTIWRLQRGVAHRRYLEAIEAYGELYYRALKSDERGLIEKLAEAESELRAAAICWQNFKDSKLQEVE